MKKEGFNFIDKIERVDKKGLEKAFLVMSTHIWRFFQNSDILMYVYKYAKNN